MLAQTVVSVGPYALIMRRPFDQRATISAGHASPATIRVGKWRIVGQLGEQARRQRRMRDALLTQQAAQRTTAAFTRRHDERRTRQEHGRNLRDHGIKARRGKLQDARLPIDCKALDLGSPQDWECRHAQRQPLLASLWSLRCR